MRCVLCKRNNKKTKKNAANPVRFYRFPTRKKDVLAKWVEFCGKDVNTATQRLCSLHFKAEDFILNENRLVITLKDSAIPSIFEITPSSTGLASTDRFPESGDSEDSKGLLGDFQTKQEDRSKVDDVLTDGKCSQAAIKPKAQKSHSKTHRNCSAKYCKTNDSDKHQRFFRFPSDKEIREKWIQILKVPKIRKFMYACSKHFKQKHWTKKLRLPRNVLPIEVTEADTPEISNTVEYDFGDEEEASAISDFDPSNAKLDYNLKFCFICGVFKWPLIRFPESKKLNQQWKDIINAPESEYNFYPTNYLCRIHFEEQCFYPETKRIRSGTLPSLKLYLDECREARFTAESRQAVKMSSIRKECDQNRICSAKYCNSNNLDENIRWFKFPSDSRKVWEKWVHLLKVPASKVRYIMYACNMHFDPKYWNGDLIMPEHILPFEVIDANISVIKQEEELSITDECNCDEEEESRGSSFEGTLPYSLNSESTPPLIWFKDKVKLEQSVDNTGTSYAKTPMEDVQIRPEELNIKNEFDSNPGIVEFEITEIKTEDDTFTFMN